MPPLAFCLLMRVNMLAPLLTTASDFSVVLKSKEKDLKRSKQFVHPEPDDVKALLLIGRLPTNRHFEILVEQRGQIHLEVLF